MFSFMNNSSNKNNVLANLFDTSNYSRVIIKKIEDIAEHYKDSVDEIILKEEFYKKASFLSGNFIVEYVDDKNYTCAYILYFQDKNGDSYKMETKSNLLDITRLSEDVQNNLNEQKTIKFDIPEPSEEFRKKYKLVKI